jgi:hypothetical protein
MSGGQSIYFPKIWITPPFPGGSIEDSAGKLPVLPRVRKMMVGEAAAGLGENLPHLYRGPKSGKSDKKN